ncbi:MAG: DNA repair protein RecN [Gammaproteobacteria bacterium]|nr:DNA repair protein RecN [Gammaproteobacteria bacterium]
MLSRIAIENLVIVRELDLGLGTGMTALTGETGAGKSILIDALGLALGDKTDNGMIRAGVDKAEINVAFDLPADSAVHAWLSEHDLDADGDCLLRRVLVRDGRSRAYINGTPSTQALLAELGALLVDIHGQHAHQSLQRGAAQRELLDAYAGLREPLREVAQRYREWRALADDQAALTAAAADRASRIDYLRFQLSEMEDGVPDADELTALDAEHDRLAHAERLLNESAGVLDQLSDGEPSLQQALQHALHVLGDLAAIDGTLNEAVDLLASAEIQIGEAASALRHYQDRVDLDPQRLQAIDDQLGRIHDLARKHRVEPEALGELHARLTEELQTLENADSNLASLARRLADSERDYRDAAATLSKARRRAAKTLSQTVTDSMQTLGMQGGTFRVTVDSDAQRAAAHGVDRVQFLVAANPGQTEAALADVASGGELSRISLAIQVATAGCGQVPTLIFDEVDVGIGGAVAEIVGQLLRTLGRERQVLCVTHLPQVASQAHQQLRVQKSSDGRTTETRIMPLDAASRIDEVARMLGGIAITEQTRRHASEMIEQAQLGG